MHMFKRTGLLLLLLAAVATAQNGKAPISRYGIGELHTYNSARERGMGSVSSASATKYSISQTNPALWGELTGIRIMGDMVFENESFDMGGNTFSYTTGRIKSLQLSFPVSDEYGSRIVGGILPVSRSEYEVTGYADESGEPYKTTYSGAGGLSAFRIGGSFEPLSSVYIGAAYEYYFGTIEQNWTLDFDNGSFYQAKEVRSTSHSGSGVLLGLYYTGINNLTLGASYSPTVALDATQNLTVRYSSGDSVITGAQGTQDIPGRLTLGATYAFNKSLLFGVEYQQQDWTDAMVFDAKQNHMGNAYTIGAGLEWIPGEVPTTEEEYWKQTVLRFGFRHSQRYIDLDPDYQKEYALSAGLGFSIMGISRADLGLEYGWSGVAEQPAGSRNFFRMTLSISAGEEWFKRRSAYDQ